MHRSIHQTVHPIMNPLTHACTCIHSSIQTSIRPLTQTSIHPSNHSPTHNNNKTINNIKLPTAYGSLSHARGSAGLLLTNNKRTPNPYIQPSIPTIHPPVHSSLHQLIHTSIHPRIQITLYPFIRLSTHVQQYILHFSRSRISPKARSIADNRMNLQKHSINKKILLNSMPYTYV